MNYVERDPAELLTGFADAGLAEDSWYVDWGGATIDAEDLFASLVPEVVDFHTSGTTGPSRSWRRSRSNIWKEGGILAALVSDYRPEAVVSFVPTVHLFGALASVVVPAYLRVPVWYRSEFFGSMPDTGRDRIVVAATPWIFTLLRKQIEWVKRHEQVTVLYGGAMLPTSAIKFLAEVGDGRAQIVEVMGSTEAGGVATRRWQSGEPPEWTLFPDVEFAYADSFDRIGAEDVLKVRSSRLAARPGELPPDSWTADDRVEVLGNRTFRLIGRTGRLAKINGRRLNLDEAEYQLSSVLECEDLAILPVFDDMIGEHIELLLVLNQGTELADLDLAAAFHRLGLRPRRVHVVPEIARGALGKLRHGQDHRH